MDRALELGINFFDTANIYGWKQGEGITENIIGRWFKQGGGRRENTVLATKVYGDMGSWPNSSGLSARHIMEACEDSLKRLRTDHIDLYQFHHVDRTAPWEEIWQACETLVAQGKVTYFGSSNFAGWHIAKANEAAKNRHFLGLVAEQSRYNLTVRTPELEVIPACRDYGLGFIPWSPLAGGILAGGGVNAKSGRKADPFVDQAYVKKHAPRLLAYEKYCAKLKQRPADVALAWLLANPIVTAPIIGPRTLQQLDDTLRVLKVKLGKKEMDQLEEIFPGPGVNGSRSLRLVACAQLA